MRKRTTLGRFAHESGVFGKVVEGKPLAVYMGDDSRGEYIYKFVSASNWSAADASPANRITTGDKYLDSGKLYVAKYNANRKLSPTGSQQGLDAVKPKTGFAFIQNDDGAYTDVTNCMMLIGRAGKVGDGTTPTLSTTRLTLRTHPST